MGLLNNPENYKYTLWPSSTVDLYSKVLRSEQERFSTRARQFFDDGHNEGDSAAAMYTEDDPTVVSVVERATGRRAFLCETPHCKGTPVAFNKLCMKCIVTRNLLSKTPAKSTKQQSKGNGRRSASPDAVRPAKKSRKRAQSVPRTNRDDECVQDVANAPKKIQLRMTDFNYDAMRSKMKTKTVEKPNNGDVVLVDLVHDELTDQELLDKMETGKDVDDLFGMDEDLWDGIGNAETTTDGEEDGISVISELPVDVDFDLSPEKDTGGLKVGTETGVTQTGECTSEVFSILRTIHGYMVSSDEDDNVE